MFRAFALLRSQPVWIDSQLQGIDLAGSSGCTHLCRRGQQSGGVQCRACSQGCLGQERRQLRRNRQPSCCQDCTLQVLQKRQVQRMRGNPS